MGERPPNDGAPWTRGELVLAFDLYCRIPFQRTKASNPEVRRTAAMLGRTPASVARKLGNFGAFDPQLRVRGISGLAHGSRLDKQIWDEFHSDWNALVSEANSIRETLGGPEFLTPAPIPPTGPSERVRSTKERLHQSFFRQTILSSYECRCCITGLNIEACLVASHIVPWSREERYRADPTNGLCLSATFDRLFDCGLLTISSSLTVLLSSQVLDSADPPSRELIRCYADRPIIRPSRFLPSNTHLEWHHRNVFIP
jgi:hypothetical protein